jgi:hypothetical protein
MAENSSKVLIAESVASTSNKPKQNLHCDIDVVTIEIGDNTETSPFTCVSIRKSLSARVGNEFLLPKKTPYMYLPDNSRRYLAVHAARFYAEAVRWSLSLSLSD